MRRIEILEEYIYDAQWMRDLYKECIHNSFLSDGPLPEKTIDTELSEKIRLLMADDSAWEVDEYDSFLESVSHSKRIEYLTPYTKDDLKRLDIKTFKLKGYNIGFALKKTIFWETEKEIIALHNNEDNVGDIKDSLIQFAIKKGGCEVYHYDGFSNELYERNGFNTIYLSMRFDEKFADSKWNYELDGRPQILLRRLNQYIYIDIYRFRDLIKWVNEMGGEPSENKYTEKQAIVIIENLYLLEEDRAIDEITPNWSEALQESLKTLRSIEDKSETVLDYIGYGEYLMSLPTVIQKPVAAQDKADFYEYLSSVSKRKIDDSEKIFWTVCSAPWREYEKNGGIKIPNKYLDLFVSDYKSKSDDGYHFTTEVEFDGETEEIRKIIFCFNTTDTFESRKEKNDERIKKYIKRITNPTVSGTTYVRDMPKEDYYTEVIYIFYEDRVDGNKDYSTETMNILKEAVDYLKEFIELNKNNKDVDIRKYSNAIWNGEDLMSSAIIMDIQRIIFVSKPDKKWESQIKKRRK